MRDQTPTKAPYSAPKLTRFGDVAGLTASGTGSVKETNTTGQPNKRTP